MNSIIYKIDEDFSIKVVQDLKEFSELRYIWGSLTESYESYLPWLGFDWFELCLKYHLNDDKLLILLLCKADRVIAIAPFVLKKEVFKGFFKTKNFELIGNVHSPIRNFIIGDSNNGAKETLITRIISYFCDVYKDWDIIELDAIPEENGDLRAFETAIVDTGVKYRISPSFGNSYLDGIDYSFLQFFNNLHRKHRKDIQRCQKGLQKIGDLRFQMITSDEGSLDYYLDLYDELREKSWKAQEKNKIFKREFVRLAAKKGWMRFSFLFCGDIPIAAEKWIVCQKKAYIMDGVYNQDYSKYSPGKVITSYIFQYVFDQDNVNEIDHMKGDEAYKKNWTPMTRRREGITIFNTTIRGQSLAFLMTKVLPVIEKNQYLLSAKNKMSGCLKKYRQY